MCCRAIKTKVIEGAVIAYQSLLLNTLKWFKIENLCLKSDFEVDCEGFCSFVYIAFHGLGWFSSVGIWFVMILLSLGRSVS